MSNQANLYVYVEKAHENFDLPQDSSVPIILISAGTGFAPMRGFLHEKRARGDSGPVYVFFGCRNETQDLIYDEELSELEQQGIITARFTGFSRSSVYPSEYVQAKLSQQKELIWELIHQKNAHVYVCGSGRRVGAGVRETFLQIITENLSCSDSEAHEFLFSLESKGRFEQDVWG